MCSVILQIDAVVHVYSSVYKSTSHTTTGSISNFFVVCVCMWGEGWGWTTLWQNSKPHQKTLLFYLNQFLYLTRFLHQILLIHRHYYPACLGWWGGGVGVITPHTLVYNKINYKIKYRNYKEIVLTIGFAKRKCALMCVVKILKTVELTSSQSALYIFNEKYNKFTAITTSICLAYSRCGGARLSHP